MCVCYGEHELGATAKPPHRTTTVLIKRTALIIRDGPFCMYMVLAKDQKWEQAHGYGQLIGLFVQIKPTHTSSTLPRNIYHVCPVMEKELD